MKITRRQLRKIIREAYIKESMFDDMKNTLDSAIEKGGEALQPLQAMMGSAEDFAAGVRSFLEKHPDWVEPVADVIADISGEGGGDKEAMMAKKAKKAKMGGGKKSKKKNKPQT